MKEMTIRWAVAMLVSFVGLVPAKALSAAVMGDDAGTTTAVSKPKTAAELPGTAITYATRASHWSVGQPTAPAVGQTNDDVEDRIFMFYNTATGKFLNLGGWWGTRTVLSDVPQLFWLQRRNEVKVTGNNLVRYPLNKGEQTIVPSLLSHLFNVHYDRSRQIGIGSQQGDESFATYNKLRVVDSATGTVAYTIDTKKGADGHFGAYHDVDLAKQRIEAEIDLSSCKDNNENILSIGSAIDKWGWGDSEKHAIADNIHIYYNATNTATKSLSAHELLVVYLGIRSNDPNGVRRSFYDVSPSSPLKLVLTDNGLEVTAVSGNTHYANVATTLTADGKIQVGSLEGVNRSNATYNKLQIVKGDGTVIKIVDDGYKAEGKVIGLAAGKTYAKDTDCGANLDFDINTDRVEAEIDLTTCKNPKENLLSIGRAIGKWLGYNLHCYYSAGNTTDNLELDYTSADKFDKESGRQSITLSDTKKPLYITYSKDGVVVRNGDTQATTLFAGMDIPFAYGAGNRIEVGNVEGANRSNATYKSVLVAGEELKDKFNAEANRATGYSMTKVIDINKDEITAEVDLTNCTSSVKENILSIGDNIKTWKGDWSSAEGYADSIGRVHIYYVGTEKKAYVDYTRRGQQERINFPVAGSTLTISLSKAKGFRINGKEYFGQLMVPYVADREGDAVRYTYKDGQYTIDDEAGKELQRIYTNYIYADESPSEKRQTYFISSKFAKSAGASGNEKNFMAYTNVSSAGNKAANAPYDCGVFADRNITAFSGMDSPVVSQWSIDPVVDTSGKGQNLYTLSLTMPYDAESDNGKDLKEKKKFYLAPSQKYVYGPEGNKWYDCDPKHTGSYSKTNEYTDVELTSTMSDLCYWKVISLKDYRAIMDNSDSELRNQVDASFLISDPDFSRESAVLNKWTAENGSNGTLDGKLRIGYDTYYKTSPKDVNYQGGGDKTRQYYSRYMAANIYNGGRGSLSQEIKVFVPGWYVVHCQGMTNVKAKLFVERADGAANATQRNTKELTAVTAEELATLRSSDPSVAHWPMDINMPLYNSAVWMNDVYRKDANLSKYDNQVLLYVDNISVENPATLRIGVEVTDGADGVATADEWTVFNYFRIQFGGASAEKEPFLILDEDFTSLDYIDKGVHPYIGKSLLLHRTFKKEQWNTFILPVNLTKAQFEGAFGEDAKLAALTGLTPTRVNFTSVKEETDGVFLKAGTPYIIWPAKEAGGNEDAVATQEIWTWESNAAKSEKVTVGKPYYTILGVTLNGPTVKANNEFEHYNFTSKTDYYDDHVYVKSAKGVNGDNRGTMVMKGTYCRTYEAGQIIDSRPTLSFTDNQYAYIMVDKAMRRLPQGKPYGTKGLRCWFEYTLDKATQTAPQVIIDGVGDETTGIDDIQDDADQPVATRYADGVYNLNGQLLRRGHSVEGLPSGVYIVNGKKVSVTNK